MYCCQMFRVSVAIVGIVALAGAADAPSLHVLTSFESAEEVHALVPGNKRVKVSLARGHATHGKCSIRVSFPPVDPRGRNWPSAAVTLGKTPDAVSDWTPYRRVELDVFNPADGKREFGVSFIDQDRHSAGYSYWKLPPLGQITISFDIDRLAQSIDCSRMQSIRFWQRLQVRRPKDRTVFFVDCVRLLPKVLNKASVKVWVLEPHFRNTIYAGHLPQRIRADVIFDLPSTVQGARAVAELIGPHAVHLSIAPLDYGCAAMRANPL